ncbi:uncharacterized protein AMSG_03005 [Thecamonas trahens ATCC 50062]|uniref:Inositol phosphatase domain-containing protein n=1 Tax=Thecamonas trahens ATCC 50062 TaxID=461836 RepID=A0A0L0D341_THETB|nr:hypothetical protein AMSG_03005 [Thecamonas trahens ATCC 50062]KNC46570.1 hypothetical protein AMSG_03005 [Thecamonas trahens ATCC 50062]|eukprot:XP_013760347.1 hypothetical protein AMSG_03005 [Thecamonas trahens ATCC 50062]
MAAETSSSGAVAECRVVVEAGEEFVDGWEVVSINQWDVEQVRVLILSTAALYRIKYKASSGEILHHHRQPLDDICRIQIGRFVFGTFAVARLFRSAADEDGIVGLRIFSAEHRGGSSLLDEAQPFRTYRAARAALVDLASPDALVRSIADAILVAQDEALGRRCTLDEFDIKRSNVLGPLSVVRNKLSGV